MPGSKSSPTTHLTPHAHLHYVPAQVSRFTHLPNLILFLLITTYALYFSWYTLNRHNTLNSYAADLSLIDQPMWNTVRGSGGFMELTWGDRQQPRLAEHFEPVLLPLALLFFIWNDVRILLIAQSAALALGALPVFWIARQQLSMSNEQLTKPDQEFIIHHSQFIIHNSVALAFAAVYLLSPHLQAANIADFHADPFVVTPLLFAFWYTTQKRWGWMWFWAIVAMSTKETLPTLTTMLGVWLVWQTLNQTGEKLTTADRGRLTAAVKNSAVGGRWSAVFRKVELLHGPALIAISTLWFLVATFLIVAPLARQHFGTDGPIYFASRYNGGLAGLPALLQDPARWCYLFGLLASVGFLPLLAPDLLILGLPVLIANLLSNFPGQYSGEQHYSAPLVVAVVIAAIHGTRRLVVKTSLREENGQTLKTTTLIAAILWLMGWSLAYHVGHGWTPLSTRMETYQRSPAAVRLPDFAAQIPAEAIVSASAAIHPHLAHRQVIYVFPTVQDADYLLVDVTDIPGTHPNDAYAKILQMLKTDWQLLQADYGLILAQKAAQPRRSSASPLPSSFFDFARAANDTLAYTTPLNFGDGRLQLLGYNVHDDPDDGVTFRFYWQTSGPLPENLRLWPLVYDDLGQLLNDPGQAPMIATVWYPPAAWQPGEIVVTETLPQLLPDTFHLGLAVGPENSLANPGQRYPIINNEPTQAVWLYPGRWAQLATFRRQGTFLEHLPPRPTLHPLTLTDTQFGSTIHLTGFWFDSRPLRPGATLPILLQWIAIQPPDADYTVFIHLLASDGSLVAQSDAWPTWLTAIPTSQWPPDQVLLDSHRLTLPNDLPPGRYQLQVGLYHSQTLERLSLPDGRNSLLLGQPAGK